MKDKAGNPFKVGMDSGVEAVGRDGRIAALAASALEEAVAGIPLAPRVRLPIYLGLPEYGRFFDERRALKICSTLSAPLVERCEPQILPVPEGNAAGLIALERAVAGIHSRAFEVCVVGGADSTVDADILEWLDDEKRLRSETNRWGFPPGEGSAMLGVCSPSFARASRLPVLASVASLQTSVEPHPLGAKGVCTGEGLAFAMAKAAQAAGTRVGRQYCDIDGDRYREHELSFALQRVPPATFLDALDYEAPVDRWGNVGAAWGPALCVLAIVVAQLGFGTTEWPMVWCGSDSGRRGALVLHLEARARQ